MINRLISVLKETEMKVNEAGGDAAARWLDSRKLRLDAYKSTCSHSKIVFNI